MNPYRCYLISLWDGEQLVKVCLRIDVNRLHEGAFEYPREEMKTFKKFLGEEWDTWELVDVDTGVVDIVLID